MAEGYLMVCVCICVHVQVYSFGLKFWKALEHFWSLWLVRLWKEKKIVWVAGLGVKKIYCLGCLLGKFYISGENIPCHSDIYCTQRWSIQIFFNIKKIWSIAFGHTISTLWLKNWNKFFHKMLENDEGLREASVHWPHILVLLKCSILLMFHLRSQSVHSEGYMSIRLSVLRFRIRT